MTNMATKRDYIRTVRIRYREARTRREKSQIIDEVVKNLRKERKYTIKILNGKYYKRHRKHTPRPPTYECDPCILYSIIY
ncbi:hypothetical protein GF389_06245 [Candidatus Dojkabacteria bacterium]|nr:hypothetical protein [Candidatus Dojkabacteria bacterium]